MSFFRRLRRSPRPLAGGFAYWVGPGGISAIETKTTGNPAWDRFLGIEDDDAPLGASDSDTGWARAYKASVWAFRCIRLRARVLASVPLRVVEETSGDEVNHPLSYALGERNNRLRRWTECDLQVYGRAFWTFGQSAGRGWLRRLNPQTVEVNAQPNGEIQYTQHLNGRAVAQWTTGQIAYFRDYDPSDDFGYVSPTSEVLHSIGVMSNISAFAEYFFANNAMPSGILVSEGPMLEGDKQRVLAEWRRNFQGVDRSNGTALLENGKLTYQPITPPLKDLAMVSLREEERRDIATVYGVPMSIAQAADPALYAAKQDYANFYTLEILPALDDYADVISTEILPYFGVKGVIVQPQTEGIEALQEDRAAITQRSATSYGAGYMSFNEARERDELDHLPKDYFMIGGRLVAREALEAGDMEQINPPASAPVSPFPGLSFPAPEQRRYELPPRVVDLPPQRAIVEVLVNSGNGDGGDRDPDTIRRAIVEDTLLRDLKRWQKKVATKGPEVAFSPDYLPDAVTAFLRADLDSWDGETPREEWIKAAFTRAEAVLQTTDQTATPEEFEAYWRGIGGLMDQVARTFEDAWGAFPARMAEALRTAGAQGAEGALTALFAALETEVADTLLGTTDAPGPLVQVVLAGAARGNDLLTAPAGKSALTIDWTVIDTLARAWAKEYAGTLIRGVNQTTLEIFRAKIADWTDGGGSLEDLAKYIQGDLAGLDIPAGWSPGKIEWATSRARARLIAQTETTRAFTEGAYTRWEQADVPYKRWRTQNDTRVDDDICRPLHNTRAKLREDWRHPKTGKYYSMPGHPSCRCFPAPDREVMQ